MSRQLSNNWQALERSLKRLSTGLRVEQASDDAAGLSIASKLRARMRGYEQASRNIQDASGLLNTAEGGLGAIQNSLQRLRLLSVVAANDTLTAQDREKLQAEADQIRHSINQTALGTEFNTMPVLRGTFKDGTPNQRKDENFARGRTQTYTVTPDVQQHTSTAIASSFSYCLRRVSTFSANETVPGWSPDDSRIEARSSRDHQFYDFASTGSTGSMSGGGTFTRDVVRMIGGKRYELTNWHLDADGRKVVTGDVYVSVDGGDPQSIVGLTGTGARDVVFSNDGTRVAFAAAWDLPLDCPGGSSTADSNVYAASFDPNALSIGGTTLINQDGDTLNVASTYALNSPPAEWYTRTSDGLKSLKVYGQSVTGGPAWEIPEDASNGFTLSADQRTITLHGAAQIDSNDILTAYYHTDYGIVTNTDDLVQIKPTLPFEVYGLGTPQASVVLERGATNIPYDPTHTNGFDFDPDTGIYTIYGNSRPSADEPLNVYYQADRRGRSAIASDEDDVVDVQLTTKPETYNLTTADPNKAMRVYVDASEVPYDATNGYTYDQSTNTVSIHGLSRPAAKETVRIVYYQDDPAPGTNQDQELQVKLDTRPDLYHMTDGGASRALRVYVAGTEVPYDATNGYTYDATSGIVTFHGTARPDVSASIEARIVSDGAPDSDYAFTLAAPAADYSPSSGSTVVTKNGTALSQRIATDGTGDGYFLAGGNVHVVGTGAPDASSTTSDTYVVNYVTSMDNSFALDTGTASYATAHCPEHFLPTLRGQVVDEATISVVVDGVTINPDPVNGYSVSKRIGPYMGGTQTYQDYAVTLNGGSRLVGAGHTIEIGYDVSYFAPETRYFSFQVGAASDDALVVGIPPVSLDELNLNDFCLDDANEAVTSLQKIDAAIATTSRYRSNIGAQINALGHQLSNVQIMGEASAQAESRIRDLDMAKEVTKLARAQILGQSGNSLMAQANQDAKSLMALLFQQK